MIIANAGQRMTSGPTVAATIGEVARRDPTVIGVVGLNESYQDTEDTVKALAGQGLPVVVATVSTDSFAASLPMYFQIAPRNVREAAVAAAYAAAHVVPVGGVRALRIYLSSDPSDVYSANLASDVHEAFTRLGFTVESVSFDPDGVPAPSSPVPADRRLQNARAAGEDACGYPGLVFYAGRTAPDFGSFLGSARNCQQLPRILADDDTTRYVANDVARRQYPSLPFDYLAFAVTTQAQAQVVPERDYYDSYARLFPPPPGVTPTLDGHAALAYDAAETFVAAAQKLRSGTAAVPINPGTVWGNISSITAPGLRGASGYIDFGGRADQHVPLDKPVLVLHVVGGEVKPDIDSFRGPPASEEPRTRPWCPHDPRGR